MSKSIRSYFTVVKKQCAEPNDDCDEIPESPDVLLKNKKKISRKKRLIEDSDEEIFTPKKKKPEATSHSKNQKSPKGTLKEVPITELFGKGKIQKTEALVVKDRTKKKTETGIHSDDEFEKSLLELDEPKDLNGISPTKESHLVKDCDNKPAKTHKETTKTDKLNNTSLKKDSHLGEESDLKQDNISDIKPAKSHKIITKTDTEQSKCNENDKLPKSSEKNINSGNKTKGNKSEIVTDIKKSKNEDKKKASPKDNYQTTEKVTKNHENKVDKESNHKSETDRPNDDIKSKKKSNKRELSEFLDDDDHETSNKRKKPSLNDSVLSDEERHEKKRLSAALYQKYLHRSGPKHLGSKEMPEGAPNCFKDCAFLLTGVLDSFERDEIVETITKYGGTLKSGISKKVTHVLAGDDAGPAKISKAESLGIKIINEDQFLDMIRQSLNGDAKKDEIEPKIKIEKVDNRGKAKKSPKDIKSNYFEKDKQVNIKKERSVSPKKESSAKNVEKVKPMEAVKKEENVASDSCDVKIHSTNGTPASLMWVDKYKPTNIRQIIGQHGEASNVKKLMNWLTKWYINRKAKLTKPNPWAKNDDGGFYKAALLSGPPGVGKTTSVSLVCKELGFDTVEFNASDTRSKNLIKEQITELLSTTSLSGFARGVTGKQAVTKKHVLVMDEVDGMAGNEDRGGLQELIALIKSTSVPIICMCNDRNSEKMRSLVNYCYDLRFSRPRVDQIKAAMMSVCFKEGIKIPGDVLSQLITAAGQDVRQTLHLLSVWSADPRLADKEHLQKEAQRVKKDIKMGPWEAIRKVFSAEEHKTMSLNDRSDLFFTDYSLAPLFVQENYLQVSPHCPKHEVLDRLSKAADSLSIGDLVDARIRGNQAWSLLPIQAMYSSVIPGQVMCGHVSGQIQFPGWLGKNSRANKMARLAQGIHAHTRLSTSGSKSSIFLDYAPHIRDAILNPLIADKMDGVQQSLQVLEEYHLLREDLDSLTELSVWPGQRNPMVLVDSKVKAAMTRTYNKQASALPYAPGAIKRVKQAEDADSLDVEEEEQEDDSDPENDALIKKKKTKEVEKPSTSKEKGQSNKGKKKK
ncbi:replication factor C subunit 1 [Zerene cesonia]|uniref:replication factor C subunit 1 n=1 Tax=Zerene cesonia TaxID=33412 RepID=UPI0018E59FED|nr:replication factor C subunit 1 [Zerene cesonia]